MTKLDGIMACTDWGIHKDGASEGPHKICDNISLASFQHVYQVEKKAGEKERGKENRRKNFLKVNEFNEELYRVVQKSIQEGNVPLTIGGDHSLSIATALASKKYFPHMGLVWFDAHADFHTFTTTETGNLHGLPFASVCGQNGKELTSFFDGTYYDPHQCVLIGARSIDVPGEVENLKKAGVHVFTTKDIQKYGVLTIFNRAIAIVTQNTDGFHFSIDADVMDPQVAPGVSVPEGEGISEEVFDDMIQCFMQYHEKIKSIDLVEYNPYFDVEDKTLKVMLKTIDIIAKKMM